MRGEVHVDTGRYVRIVISKQLHPLSDYGPDLRFCTESGNSSKVEDVSLSEKFQ